MKVLIGLISFIRPKNFLRIIFRKNGRKYDKGSNESKEY